MTAITLLIRELYDLSDAFWHNQFHFERSLRYYHTKRRLQLFHFHCREHWMREYKKNRLGYEYNQTDSMQHAGDTSIDFAAIEASFYEYSDAQPKFQTDQIGELVEGVSFTFTGKIPINCERFSINFVYNNEARDIALHINPRLPQNYIVRNTKVYDVWGREEVSSALPFLLRRGDKFAIQVLITSACYMISVNGHHFAEYAHRLPYGNVKILEVKGDVEEIGMERTIVQSYPKRLPESAARSIDAHLDSEKDEVDCNVNKNITNTIPHEWCLINSKLSDNSPKNNCNTSDLGLTLPYYGTLLPKSLKEGRCLKIEGRVRLLPHSFYINLQQGQNIWPHPIIAFHLNPRFSQTSNGAIGKAIVCRNAWYNGGWAQEERSELDTNLRPGRTFCLAIVCSHDSFEVYVNNQFITEFKYQIKPDMIDTVYIQGDVKLWKVTLELNPIIKGKNIRIYHNPLYTEES
ncbi:galectin-9 isoform X2 [Drosophila sulfurigaster albostrigata]|uniref:galectin-9 isoform X2 n=1 Tax=Drosophila sulfurigaster albostrigata TaxID=89887 RepID=UPI002D21AA1A|nr:galectin-9 isoform X2 [Drosophila sulfurigaster albostrigata]